VEVIWVRIYPDYFSNRVLGILGVGDNGIYSYRLCVRVTYYGLKYFGVKGIKSIRLKRHGLHGLGV
jgi:hypothetical protein